MKILFQSILFIIVVALFAVTSDRLSELKTQEAVTTQTSSTSMSDQDFLTNMIEHHEGAVAMARQAEAKSTRAEVRAFADQIITAQTKEIADMYAWRKEWFGDDQHVEMRMGAQMPSMAIDLGKADADFDKRFLEAMIAHHQGAIDMANKVIVPTTRPEIHNFASNIVTIQSEEINKMKSWLKEWYGK
jgi:uncharacterized protein (DUF305 family)